MLSHPKHISRYILFNVVLSTKQQLCLKYDFTAAPVVALSSVKFTMYRYPCVCTYYMYLCPYVFVQLIINIIMLVFHLEGLMLFFSSLTKKKKSSNSLQLLDTSSAEFCVRKSRFHAYSPKITVKDLLYAMFDGCLRSWCRHRSGQHFSVVNFVMVFTWIEFDFGVKSKPSDFLIVLMLEIYYFFLVYYEWFMIHAPDSVYIPMVLKTFRNKYKAIKVGLLC